MRPAIVIVASAVSVVAALSLSSSLRAATVSRTAVAKQPCRFVPVPPAAPTGEITLWGHIESLVRRGRRFELRFDPALWLGGATATRAAIEDKAIRPGEAVPNDYYVRDVDHRLLTYLVPATARATVIVNTSQGFCARVVPVSELAQIVRGRNPKHRPLFDRANGLGYWIRVATDTIRSLDQQYQP